jgi:hypothetical protein
VALAGLLLCGADCGDRRGETRACDQVEAELREILGNAVRALGSSDASELRRNEDELVRLRLRAQALRMRPPLQAARDSLLVALDAVADGINAAILGTQSAAAAVADPRNEWKDRTDRLRSSAAQMNRCEEFLGRAASALDHSHEARAGAEVGGR